MEKQSLVCDITLHSNLGAVHQVKGLKKSYEKVEQMLSDLVTSLGRDTTHWGLYVQLPKQYNGLGIQNYTKDNRELKTAAKHIFHDEDR